MKHKNWYLIDDSHPKFDRWQHRNGFVETFDKGHNPNERLFIGEILNEYLLDNNMSSRDLAKKTDINSGIMSGIIKGNINPSQETIEKLEEATGLQLK